MKLTAQQQKQKSELIERIQMIDSPDLLYEVKEILDRHTSEVDFWETLSEKQKALVRKGMAEFKEGKGIPAREVLRG
jgi:hypothetical protein